MGLGDVDALGLFGIGDQGVTRGGPFGFGGHMFTEGANDENSGIGIQECRRVVGKAEFAEEDTNAAIGLGAANRLVEFSGTGMMPEESQALVGRLQETMKMMCVPRPPPPPSSKSSGTVLKSVNIVAKEVKTSSKRNANLQFFL